MYQRGSFTECYLTTKTLYNNTIYRSIIIIKKYNFINIQTCPLDINREISDPAHKGLLQPVALSNHFAGVAKETVLDARTGFLLYGLDHQVRSFAHRGSLAGSFWGKLYMFYFMFIHQFRVFIRLRGDDPVNRKRVFPGFITLFYLTLNYVFFSQLIKVKFRLLCTGSM